MANISKLVFEKDFVEFYHWQLCGHKNPAYLLSIYEDAHSEDRAGFYQMLESVVMEVVRKEKVDLAYLRAANRGIDLGEVSTGDLDNASRLLPIVRERILALRQKQIEEREPGLPTHMEPPTPERKAQGQATEKITARQVALFIYYRIAAGENGLLPNGERVATWQKLGKEYSLAPKNIELAYGKISSAKNGRDEREKAKTPHNLNDHKAIIPILNDYPSAQRLAQSTLKTIEDKT